jgi:hypothetical protein
LPLGCLVIGRGIGKDIASGSFVGVQHQTPLKVLMRNFS